MVWWIRAVYEQFWTIQEHFSVSCSRLMDELRMWWFSEPLQIFRQDKRCWTAGGPRPHRDRDAHFWPCSFWHERFFSCFVTMPSLVISLFLNLSGAYPKDTARPWRTSLSSHCTPWPHTACEIQSMRFGDPEMLKEWTINESLAVPKWVYLQISCSPENTLPLHPMHYFPLFVNVIVH